MSSVIDVNKRLIGVNFLPTGEATIKLWAPLIDDAKIVLGEEQGKIDLSKDPEGYWSAKTNKIKPGALYKFEIDNSKQLPDPASLSQPNGVHQHSQAIELNNFQWKDQQWKNLPLKKYIIYEVHTGTFSQQGTFAGIQEKLDHLLELGITAIEIMPVAQFPGKRNWGYDGVYPFAVQFEYGGAAALQELVNTCHLKGIAVILDVVYNHIGPEGNYLKEYGPYFTDKYKTPWGSAINFDDEWCDGVRNFFVENAIMWFRDFHIDALRLDAVHAIKDFSPVHILQDIKEAVNEFMNVSGTNHYLIVESDLNDTRFINPIDRGGYGMDAQWIDEFHHALRIAAGGEPTGYFSDFNGVAHLAKAYKDAYVYDGQYSIHRKKKFGVRAKTNEGKQFIVFSQNHDQVGNRMLGERTSQLVSFEMQKLLAGAVMVSPYLPLLFMGEEWSETNPFQYFVSHTDPDLAEAVRTGRKKEFAAFNREGEAPDPMSEETFNHSKLQWLLLEEEPHKTMFHYYQYLIRLRKQHPVLKELNRKNILVASEQESKMITLKRWEENLFVFVVLNFSNQAKEVALPDEIKGSFIILNSAHHQWGGTISTTTQQSQSIIQPESITIFSNYHV